MSHVPFLRDYFIGIVGKGQLVLLPYSLDKYIIGLMLISPRVKEEQNRNLKYLSDYSFSTINDEYLPIVALSIMQYGQALYRLLREVVYHTQLWDLYTYSRHK